MGQDVCGAQVVYPDHRDTGSDGSPPNTAKSNIPIMDDGSLFDLSLGHSIRQAANKLAPDGDPCDKMPPTFLIPDKVPKELEDAFDASNHGSGEDPPDGKRPTEQGGRIIRTQSGEYQARRGKPGSENEYPDENRPNADESKGEENVGVYHTHPYRDPANDDVGPSSEDVENVVNRGDENYNSYVVTGKAIYVLVLCNKDLAKAKGINAIIKDWQDAYMKAKGSLGEKTDAANRAVTGKGSGMKMYRAEGRSSEAKLVK